MKAQALEEELLKHHEKLLELQSKVERLRIEIKDEFRWIGKVVCGLHK